MRRATFLTAVRQDFRDIAAYLAEASGSANVGRGFARRLRERCHGSAALQATVGRPRPELRADIRSCPYGEYVIFFRYSEDSFEVARILERHRDIGVAKF